MSQDSVRFALLGSVRCWRGGTEVDLGRPQQRALLALLMARAGRPVPVGDLVDTLWGQNPPDSAVNAIRRQVGSLRRVLEPARPMRAPGRWLLRGAGGYRLEADADSLDLLRFRRLRDEARWAERGGASERAVELFAEALALWHGPAGTGTAGATRSTGAGAAAAGVDGYAVPVPAQLPHDLPVFTGRRAELDEALARMPDGRRPVSTVLITAIGGAAGIGRTTLAVHWAHRVAGRFPDGQFYVNLRGFGPAGTAMNPGEAVRGFLAASGCRGGFLAASGCRRSGSRTGWTPRPRSGAACWPAQGPGRARQRP